MREKNRKKLRVGDLKVEPFEPGKREESDVAVMEMTAPEACGETDDFWACASYEPCHESHPYQRICM